MVHSGRRQQARNRGVGGVHTAVRQDDDAVAGRHRLAGLPAQLRHRAGETRAPFRRVVEQRQRRRAEWRSRRQVAELGDLVVVEDRIFDRDLPAGLGRRFEQVALGPDGRGHGRDDLFTNGVERRVGDLREELREVVVEQARPIREHGQRGVGAHRADGFFAGGAHRRQQHPEVFLRVAEGLLTFEHRLVIGALGPGRRQRLDVHDVLAQPVAVGAGGGQLTLDLVVADDGPARGVHQQHAAGPQPVLAHDALGGHVEHADLRRHDDEVVVGDQVARRAQAVSVEDGADEGAVGEGDRGRPVPRLHERRVVLVEGAHGRVHVGIPAPRLGNHHQHGVRQRAARHHQELEHVVEGGGVAAARPDDRQHLGEVVAEHARREQALAGLHPVDVAAQRVDLAVVGDDAVGVGERPGGEGVGRETLVHEGEGRDQAGIAQVGVHGLDLRGRQHALVDERLRRQAHDVERLARRGRDLHPHHGSLHAFADDVERPFEPRRVVSGRRGDEDLLEGRRDGGGRPPDAVEPGRHHTPAQHRAPFLGGDGVDEAAQGGRGGGVVGQEDQPGAVVTGRRQVEGERRAEERVWHLQEDAGAVAGARVGAAGAAVLQVDQEIQRLPHDIVRLAAFEMGDEADAAGVVLVTGPVESLVAGYLVHVAPPEGPLKDLPIDKKRGMFL